MPYKAPLRLFWYAKEPNFGDAISQTVVAHVSGREVEWAGHANCELYALGSLMRSVATQHQEPRVRGKGPLIWGTGAMGAVPLNGFRKNVRVCLLRGPITAALMQRDDRLYGDPGLLIADALGEDIAREDVIGLVPHMHFADDEDLHEIAERDPRLRLIDVRNPDPLAVVRQIASCAHVISQSLHGLIVADAYGIPNTWLDPDGIHGGAMLKFHDYAAGIGRAMGTPIDRSDIPAVMKSAKTADLPYAEGISTSKEALYYSFPEGLKRPVDLAGGEAAE